MSLNRKCIYILFCLILLGCVIFSIFVKITHPFLYEKEISEFSKKYSVDEALIASVINVESKFNKNATSNKGAIGLMQIIPSTGKWVFERIEKKKFENKMLFNPKYNINIGTWYLSYLIDKFKSVNLALYAYNAGEGNVKNWLKDSTISNDGLNINNCPFKETELYVKRIKNNYIYYIKQLNKYK